MKYVVTLFWSFILGQIVFYLGSALSQGTYDFTQGTILGIVIAMSVFIIARIIGDVQTDNATENHSN